MSHKNKYIQLLAKSFLLSIGLTLAACGGGGGGGGDDGIPNATVKYSGNTQPATVDVTTAENIVNAFVTASQENLGGMITGAQITTVQNTFTETQKKLLIEKLKQHALSNVNQNLVVTGIGAFLTGDCAFYDANLSNGTVTSSILSQSPSKVVVKISYNNVCLYNNLNPNNPSYLQLTGDVYSTTTGNLQAGIINTLDLYIPTLTGKFVDISTSQTYVEVFSEQITFIYEDYVNGLPSKITIIDKSDIDSTGTVYRFEVETITINNSTITKLKFYHPDYGWVGYIDNLTYGSCGSLPDGGSITIIGLNAVYTVDITSDANCNYTFSARDTSPTVATPPSVG